MYVGRYSGRKKGRKERKVSDGTALPLSDRYYYFNTHVYTHTYIYIYSNVPICSTDHPCISVVVVQPTAEGWLVLLLLV